MTPFFDRRSADKTEDDDNSWESWRKLVLSKLEGVDLKFEEYQKQIIKQNDEIISLRLEWATHKGKVAGIGAVVALATTLIVQILSNMRK